MAFPLTGHIRLKMMQQRQGWKAATVQKMALVPATRTFVLKGCHPAAINLIRGATVPGMAFWHDLGLSGRTSHADSWCEGSRNGVLARLRTVRTQQ
eukprot:5253644-Pyramimonas_sp.AAC.1